MSQDYTSPVKTTKALDEYVLLGRSGLRISPLCLGTVTFGEQWGVGADKEKSKKVFDLYYERGGNFFGNFSLIYVVNNKSFHNFSNNLIITYIFQIPPTFTILVKFIFTANRTAMLKDQKFNPNFGGNHRKSLVENLDESLKRLNMNYVDILYAHMFEYRTPIEEMMRSLDDVIRSGKALYVAVSDIPSWALARANTIAELRGWSPFIGLQTRYSLLNRSFEFDLQPACAELDVGVIPWVDPKLNIRNKAIGAYSKSEKNWKILDEVIAISEEIDRSPVQVALNWVQQKPGITSSLIGARTVSQLEENLRSLEFKLTPEQMKRLDDVSKPNEVPFPHKFANQYDRYIGKNIQVPNKFAPIVKAYNYGSLY
ncbi:2271_t:CDS:10 [Rhizophagus irregularis]|nr:2271_t:CDS:10 [Rhizophagus irregularis]